MSQKLGEIKKPWIKDFRKGRKLFCLPLIPQVKENEFKGRLKDCADQFWRRAAVQIKELEKVGKINRVFFESATKDGNAGLEMIKQLSKQNYDIIKEKINDGAELVAIENKDVLDEFFDWSICLSVVRNSSKVFNRVLEFYKDVAVRRNKEIAERIDVALKENEAGLLIMTDENRLHVQSYLPSDIQVFLIHPPAFNEIMRCFRDYMKNQDNNK